MIMTKSVKVKPSKPMWRVHVRPMNESHGPWEIMNVEARSVTQAQAIVGRKGYEMAIDTAILMNRPDWVFASSKPPPLCCTSCGYSLAGLMIEETTVICPECSYPQPIFAWTRDQEGVMSKKHPIIDIFAVIGMAGTSLVFLLIVLLLLL